jgi:arsenite methyltransferase
LSSGEELAIVARNTCADIAVTNRSYGRVLNDTASGGIADDTVMGAVSSMDDSSVAEADPGSRGGLHSKHAGIREGGSVLDPGSGAEDDVFIARRDVGTSGKAIGVDFTGAYAVLLSPLVEIPALILSNDDQRGFRNNSSSYQRNPLHS